MTQTLTTKVLNDFITGQGYGVAPSAVEAMARELLANREAQPVEGTQFKPVADLYVVRVPDDASYYVTDASEAIRIAKRNKGNVIEEYVHTSRLQDAYTAQPAPAVPDKPRLPPHVYRDLLDMLQEAAIAYGGTQQLRAQLSSALSIQVQPDHPHTRAPMLAAAPEGGN
jgi:hypothetical protein